MSPSMSLERDDQGHDRHSPAPKPVAERLPFGRAGSSGAMPGPHDPNQSGNPH